MTENQLRRRIESWQAHLAPLGLDHWRIDSVTIESDDANRASVQVARMYDSCHFHFDPEFLAEADDQELDEVIIHEWVHVAMRDWDQAIEAIEGELSPASKWQWNDRMHHEREGLVDHIARQIYASYNAT